jgi:hypothetical protein
VQLKEEKKFTFTEHLLGPRHSKTVQGIFHPSGYLSHFLAAQSFFKFFHLKVGVGKLTYPAFPAARTQVCDLSSTNQKHPHKTSISEASNCET